MMATTVQNWRTKFGDLIVHRYHLDSLPDLSVNARTYITLGDQTHIVTKFVFEHYLFDVASGTFPEPFQIICRWARDYPDKFQWANEHALAVETQHYYDISTFTAHMRIVVHVFEKDATFCALKFGEAK